MEMTPEQNLYITSSLDRNVYLNACPGSGKTEVIAQKAANEISEWKRNPSGLAFISFSNSASIVLRQRILKSLRESSSVYPHFIGTFDSFIFRYLVNPKSYLFTGYLGVNGDYSVRIVDNNSRLFISTKYSYEKRGKLRANTFSFDLQTNRYEFNTQDKLWNLALNSMQLARWQIDDLNETKQRFLKAGFSTYKDVEHLAIKTLTDERTKQYCENLSIRFPTIIIDECQDLSLEQIHIISYLSNFGIKIHLIGDLNQSIYGFRNSNPQNILSFITNYKFDLLYLTKNFRSEQQIVDCCCSLVNCNSIEGLYKTSSPCCYLIEYLKDPIEIIQWFKDVSIEFNDRVVVARGHSTLAKLKGYEKEQNDVERLANSIALFREDDLESLKQSMLLISELFNNKLLSNKPVKPNSFNCPQELESSLQWRYFLHRTLKYLVDCGLKDMTVTWSSWCKVSKNSLRNVIKQPFVSTEIRHVVSGLSTISVTSPKGKAEEGVGASIVGMPTQSNGIRIATIHEVKGETHDATLLISSTKSGKESHWKDWLSNPNCEAARMAYVASSRPRHLLVWAVKKLDASERERLTKHGFQLVRNAYKI